MSLNHDVYPFSEEQIRFFGLEFVGWMCPCHRRVVRANDDGSKPAFHLISKDEGKTQCTLNPELWMECFVKPPHYGGESDD